MLFEYCFTDQRVLLYRINTHSCSTNGFSAIILDTHRHKSVHYMIFSFCMTFVFKLDIKLGACSTADMTTFSARFCHPVLSKYLYYSITHFNRSDNNQNIVKQTNDFSAQAIEMSSFSCYLLVSVCSVPCKRTLQTFPYILTSR